MSELSLPPEQKAEAEALFARLKSAFEQEAWQMAQLLARKEDGQLLGGDGVRDPGARASAGGAGDGERPAGAKKKGYRGARMGCPHCPESAR